MPFGPVEVAQADSGHRLEFYQSNVSIFNSIHALDFTEDLSFLLSPVTDCVVKGWDLRAEDADRLLSPCWSILHSTRGKPESHG